MATRKINAVLPEKEQSILRELRSASDQSHLHTRVIALRDAGWPLRAIAEGLDVSRMSIQMWETAARKDDEIKKAAATITVPVLPLDARGSGTSAKRMRMDVPPHDRERLAELATQARLVRGWTPKDAPERKAAYEFDQLLIKYVENRKVTAMSVARHARVTRRAIVARIERAHEREKAGASK